MMLQTIGCEVVEELIYLSQLPAVDSVQFPVQKEQQEHQHRR